MGDTAGPNPTLLRVRLGRELKRVAAAAGKTPAEVARYIGASESTVSRIYNGRQAARVSQVRSLATLCGIPADEVERLVERTEEAGRPGWWAEFGDTVPEWLRTLLGLEGVADEIATYQSELVPGLVQTADYTAAIARRNRPSASAEEIARSVAFRQARQRHTNPERMRIVLNEAVLCRPVGGPVAWRAQLEHLIRLGDEGHAVVQVLPFAVGEHPVMGSSFKILKFDEEPTLNAVYLESDRSGGLLRSVVEIRRYEAVFEDLASEAASPEDSRRMLVKVASHL